MSASVSYFSKCLKSDSLVQPLNLQNSSNVVMVIFYQEWKNGLDVLKPPCLAPDGTNSRTFKAFGHTGLITHISQAPSRILFAKLPHILCFLCNKRLFYWPLFLKKYFLIIHLELHIQPDLLPLIVGAWVTTQVLLIAKEGPDCGLWLGKRKTASREQHLLGIFSFIKQEGHAFISLQSWCAIPLLGWRLTSTQLWPFAAQQNLLLKWVLPLY